jgi:hypothetical protein
MSERFQEGPLQPGDRAPNVVLQAITHPGQIAIDDFRGQKPLLIGLFRGLHCPFCRRHIAAQAQLDKVLRERGVECLTVVNTPIDRARLAAGGFSDGASYAISLGLVNGDLFTHVAAFSPGFYVADELHGRTRFWVSHGRADEILPIESTLHLLSDKDEKKRETAFGGLGKTLNDNARLFTHITNVLAKDKEISDRWRGYEDIADSRHMANSVEREVVDALETAVR